MESFLTASMPLALLLAGLFVMARLVIPRRIFEITAGVVLRDVFWLLLALTGTIVLLPFRLLGLLVGPPRGRRRGRRRRRNW